MNDSVAIRPYIVSDKSVLLDLLRLNTPEFFATEEETDFSTYLDNELDLYYVLEFDGKVVGCGGINFADSNTTAKISWDIFHPNYQGKSLGAKLLYYRLEKIETMNTVTKTMVRTSQLAYKFYEKQGFKLLEISKDYWAEGFDMYLMEYQKKLN